MRCLIEPQRVIAIAYAGSGYIPQELITQSDIITAQQRYLIPVVGEGLFNALMMGEYTALYDDYVEPALAHFVKIIVDAPASPATKRSLTIARTMMRRLSDYLDDNARSYPEYSGSENILKRVRLDGGFVQKR
ncbi:MAG: hypothetical protein SNG35_01800 [Rikenellaceae bacterium]